MKIKPSYLVMAISLFLVIVFLDQNRNPVPIKIILGGPFHLGLSLIIIISMLLGVIMTIGVVYLTSRRRTKDKDK
ncbi:MAG: LapA family protein [Syntrophales bacterium LBB04]|nr:LapA family protein [Syntrophales bacterium LBB04]